MRRFVILLLCTALLVGVVYADNQADEVRNTTTVHTDGSAQVALTVKITLDEPVEDLTFPLPKGAEDVTMNSEPVETRPSRANSSVDLVDLSHLDGVTGPQSMTFSYTLPAVVGYAETDAAEEAERPLELRLPLLSGFEYPVEFMTFAVTLPADTAAAPSFYSGYFLQSIESNLSYKINDGVISGTVTDVMKDKETLLMTLDVTAEQFPDLVIVENEENIHLFAMVGMTGIALLFWLLFLHSLPVYPRRRNMPPVGIHAGELGSRLTMEGGDLTMMVFQWAQLGYIRIVPDKRDRVWLHKRMEMGNERTPFEVKCFHQLFGRHESIEGTGTRYGRLWYTVRHTINDKDQITPGGLGAKTVFRVLAMLVSVLAGASMGMNLIEEGAWRMVLAAAFAIAGGITAWQIQAGTMKLHLRQRDAVPGCILCCVLWLGAGIATDRLLAGLLSTVIQLIAGIFTAWGGRRTRAGWRMACKVLGLRRYLKGAKRDEIKEELARNPDYFFEMIPYAMALGVENAFAKRFGSRIMPQCSYLDADRASKRNAREWTHLMRQTAEKLDIAGKKTTTYRR